MPILNRLGLLEKRSKKTSNDKLSARDEDGRYKLFSVSLFISMEKIVRSIRCDKATSAFFFRMEKYLNYLTETIVIYF